MVELRQTQNALRAQAYQTRALDVIQGQWVLAGDPEMSILIARFQSGDTDINSLSPNELSKLTSFYYIRRTDLDNEHYQYQNGYLDLDFYNTTTVREMRILAPNWRGLGIREPRNAFTAEIDRILAGSVGGETE